MSLGIVLFSLILNLSTSWAETIQINTTEPVICFTEADAKTKILLPLENSIDYQQEIELLKQTTQELEKQIVLLKEMNKLQSEQLELSKQTIESYKKLLDSQKEAYERKIENEKPSIWGKIAATFGGLGIGILIGLLL